MLHSTSLLGIIKPIMFIFLMANLPLPIILYLNYRVTLEFYRVHKLTKHAAMPKPPKLILGWCMSNLAVIFVLIPPLSEHRLFVEDARWLISYAISAALTIGGLLLMKSVLDQELKELVSPPAARRA